MRRKNINLEENIIDDSTITKALCGLKEVSPPENLLKDAIADARKNVGRPVFNRRAKAFRPISWKYVSAAAALVICLGLGYVFAISPLMFNSNGVDIKGSVAEEAGGVNTRSDLSGEKDGSNNQDTGNTNGNDLAATTSPSDAGDIMSDTSTQSFTSHASYENRSDLIDVLSEIETCGVKTDELSDDIVIYANDAADIINILNSYVYDLTDEQGANKPMDELSGIITIKVEFE